MCGCDDVCVVCLPLCVHTEVQVYTPVWHIQTVYKCDWQVFKGDHENIAEMSGQHQHQL